MPGDKRRLLGSADTLVRSHGAVYNPNHGSRTVKDNANLQGTAFHRIDTALRCCSFTEVYRNRLWFQVITFTLVSFFDFADMFSDWSLLSDCVHVKPGLVFGPPEDNILYALLFFSILGTATFSIELVNVALEIFYNQPIIDPELLTVCTIWLEDVPQIIINIFIAMCREDAISYFQIIKVAVIIIGGFIRVLMGFIRFGDRQQDIFEKRNPKTGCKHKTYRFFIIFGILLLFLSSVVVCFLTLFERTPDGTMKFGTPKGLFYGQYDREKFFDNVSIYMNLPILEYDNSTDNTSFNWIRLTSIYDIKDKNGDTFKLSYDNATTTKFVLWQSTPNNKLILETKECFYIDRDNKILYGGTNNCDDFLDGEDIESLIIQFELVPEKIPELIFGDINFNIRHQDQNGCRNITRLPVDNIGDRIDKTYRHHPVIHYYRAKANVSETNHLKWDSTSNPQFFHFNKDLIDISTVWKTGVAWCKSTGSLAPHRNSSIHIEC